MRITKKKDKRLDKEVDKLKERWQNMPDKIRKIIKAITGDCELMTQMTMLQSMAFMTTHEEFHGNYHSDVCD